MEEKTKKRGLKIGLSSKIVSLSLPITIVMVVILIVTSYTISKSNIMESSENLLNTSVKDQSHQIEAWMNRKLDEVKTVKYDIEHSGALKDEKLLQQKLDYYYDLDGTFNGGFYIADASGSVKKASSSENTYSSVKDQIWYTQGLTRLNPNYTSAYEDGSGKQVISVCSMLNDLDNIRVISTNLSLDSISIIVNSSVSMPDAESLLINKTDGTILAARDSSLVSTSVNNSSDAFLKGVADKISSGNYDLTSFENNAVAMREITGSDWILVSYTALSNITAGVNTLRTRMILIAAICLVVLIIVSVFNVFITVRPLKTLAQKIRAMADGDFTIEINPKGHDEISDIQRSVYSFLERMREIINRINAITDDLQTQADSSSSISNNLHSSSETQASSMSSLNDTVDQFTVSISEIADSATNLSDVVSETSKDSDAVKEQIDTTVKISKRGRADMESVKEAMDSIRESIDILVEAINKVGTASHEITGITELIGNISEQTELLSLNASIEAARAGEAGKGFSVVATEIGKLAQTTAESVENIAKIVTEVDSLVDAAVTQADRSVEHITDSGQRIDVAVTTFDEIYKCIQDVETGINKMVSEMETVNNVAMDVSALSEEQAASTALISDTSEKMVQQANNLASQSEQVADGAKILIETSEELNRHMSKFNV